MVSCENMKKGEVYKCQSCGFEIEVKKHVIVEQVEIVKLMIKIMNVVNLLVVENH